MGKNLQAAGLISGGRVAILAGSDSDKAHMDKLSEGCSKYGLPVVKHISQPGSLEEVVKKYNKSVQRMVILACAGGTDDISQKASFHSVHPVVSCPSDGLNESCLANMPTSSTGFVLQPGSATRFAAQALGDESVKKVLEKEAAGEAQNGVHADEVPEYDGLTLESRTKAKIATFLSDCVDECVIPELGEATKGKVRDIYMVDDKVVMITNDRVSAFDFVLPNLIPFKGRLLNAISKWSFAQTADIVPNPLCDQPDPNVVVQKKMKNLMVEAIVRGYLWGSMAAAYEKGERVFCGLRLPEGMVRYQKLAEPLFTPTTKAEVGHDENMTMNDVVAKMGPELAAQVKEVSLKLYARGAELMKKRGLILLDTKYEFGVDENGKLFVIDEVNTPDSSRMCAISEYEAKWPRIQKEGLTPELKIKEYSKQYVRDTLLEMGFDGTKALKLPPSVVAECAFRYISVYEQITGEKFQFPTDKLEGRIGKNLEAAGLISSGCVAVFAASESDKGNIQKIADGVAKYGLPCVTRICCAAKQPAKLEELLTYYNRSVQRMVVVASAGGAEALSSAASFHSIHPVVSCPPEGTLDSGLSSTVFECTPGNTVRFAAQLLCGPDVQQGLLEDARKARGLPADAAGAQTKADEVPAGTYTGLTLESRVKTQIAKYLNDCVDDTVIPELGEAKKGKVRDIYFVKDKVVMVTNDRVSAFDFVLPNLIPFKGQVLNEISKWTMSQTADICPNALCEQPDPNVVVQKKMKNLNIEAICRGYLWGSMANAYEKGDRTFCGLKLPDGLLRYQKLDEPLFTPTTKAEVGHDENMTMAQVEAQLGADLAKKVKETALKLYQRGVEVFAKRGLILLDTKYEFGLDEKGELYVIDEVNTPDSSRMCSIAEYESKWPRIKAEGMKPELKIKEYSKQYVRDTLLEMGFDGTKALKLPPSAVVECAFRYISVYEQI